jgi:hypothetical protein
MIDRRDRHSGALQLVDGSLAYALAELATLERAALGQGTCPLAIVAGVKALEFA